VFVQCKSHAKHLMIVQLLSGLLLSLLVFIINHDLQSLWIKNKCSYYYFQLFK